MLLLICPYWRTNQGERLKHGGRKRGVMLFGSFRGPFLYCFYRYGQLVSFRTLGRTE
ncbi:DNA-binding transcriptional regulator AraC, partial [Pseudomonas donghuensis]|nr:DNA-binding transcriptional regulator AraC [Pseudomonas donghuensis]